MQVFVAVGRTYTTVSAGDFVDESPSGRVQEKPVAGSAQAPRQEADRTQEFMTRTGDKRIDAFVCLESSSGKIVSDAVQRANGIDRLVVAWDANPDTLNAIKSGKIDSTTVQKPFTMAFVGLRELDTIFHSPKQPNQDFRTNSFSPYPEFVDTGTSPVDKHNVDTYIASATAGNR